MIHTGGVRSSLRAASSSLLDQLSRSSGQFKPGMLERSLRRTISIEPSAVLAAVLRTHPRAVELLPRWLPGSLGELGEHPQEVPANAIQKTLEWLTHKELHKTTSLPKALRVLANVCGVSSQTEEAAMVRKYLEQILEASERGWFAENTVLSVRDVPLSAPAVNLLLRDRASGLQQLRGRVLLQMAAPEGFKLTIKLHVNRELCILETRASFKPVRTPLQRMLERTVERGEPVLHLPSETNPREHEEALSDLIMKECPITLESRFLDSDTKGFLIGKRGRTLGTTQFACLRLAQQCQPDARVAVGFQHSSRLAVAVLGALPQTVVARLQEELKVAIHRAENQQAAFLVRRQAWIQQGPTERSQHVSYEDLKQPARDRRHNTERFQRKHANRHCRKRDQVPRVFQSHAERTVVFEVLKEHAPHGPRCSRCCCPRPKDLRKKGLKASRRSRVADAC